MKNLIKFFFQIQFLNYAILDTIMNGTDPMNISFANETFWLGFRTDGILDAFDILDVDHEGKDSMSSHKIISFTTVF